MNTPSHMIITAALAKPFRHNPLPLNPANNRRFKILKGALLWGAVAPDVPLYLLTLGGWIYYCLILGWDASDAFRYMFQELFFKDPFWIATHNALHSPILLMFSLGVLWQVHHIYKRDVSWLVWFFLACLFHTAVDIPLHVEDGPLLLFPLNWSIRFQSVISYWDPRYYGNQFIWFEIGLDMLLLLYLGRDRISELLKL